MAFGSESEESEGASEVIFSKLPTINILELNKTLGKSSAYWKSKEAKTTASDKKKYPCIVKGCDASFSRPWRLKAHLSVHSGKKPFPCDIKDCTKAYTSISHLRRHKANAHEPLLTIKKSYKCEFSGCSTEFKTLQNAKKHYKRTHERRTCKECDKIFTKRSQLVTHQYEHTGIKPFKCGSCDFAFLRKCELRRHERNQHTDHICPEKGCFLTFKTWNEVRKHLVIHPKNYICILCRKSYVCRKNLKEHIHKHANPEFMSKRKTSLKKLQCEQCAALLVGKASLKRHISVIHEGKLGQAKDPVDPPKQRAPRKDKGIVKRAMAPVLAQVNVPYPFEKKLLQRTSDLLVDDEELMELEAVFQEITKQISPEELNSTVNEDACSSSLTAMLEDIN